MSSGLSCFDIVRVVKQTLLLVVHRFFDLFADALGLVVDVFEEFEENVSNDVLDEAEVSASLLLSEIEEIEVNE